MSVLLHGQFSLFFFSAIFLKGISGSFIPPFLTKDLNPCTVCCNSDLVQSVWGGGVTFNGYMYICLPFVVFIKFGIGCLVIGGFSSETKELKLKKREYLEQIIVKSTKSGQNCMLFYQKLYTDGWVIGQKIGIEKVTFLRLGRHIQVRF